MFSTTPRILFKDESEPEVDDDMLSSSDPWIDDKRNVISSLLDDSDDLRSADHESIQMDTHVLSSSEVFQDGLEESELHPTFVDDGSQILSSHYLSNMKKLKLNTKPHTPENIVQYSERSFDNIGTSFTPIRKISKSFFKQDVNRKGKKRRNSFTPKLANINPFTPKGMIYTQNKKRRKTSSSTFNGSYLNKSPTSLQIDVLDLNCSENDSDQEVNFHFGYFLNSSDNVNYSRYSCEFIELSQIGNGEFGSVYKCINKLDGCIYALKKTKKPICGSLNEKRALNEVYAHAALGKHSRVVRYFNAWAENDHMFIQNEYCEGGSLANLIIEMRKKSEKFTENHLKKILIHVAQGLKYIHSQNLVHLDIKPENIFISPNISLANLAFHKQSNDSSSDDGFEDSVDKETHISDITYKIGDLGHVTSILNPQVEEGDCRYMPFEILHENYNNLQKADIFSLGLTIYEAAIGKNLPRNGEEWHRLRNNQISKLEDYSDEFNKLIKRMVNKDPDLRPTSSNLLKQSIFVTFANKTRSQLRKELNIEKLRNEILTQKLEEASKNLINLEPVLVSKVPIFQSKVTNLYRSKSLTSF